MIYWDVDGVLRNQSAIALGGYPNEWDVKVGSWDFVEFISRNLEILELSPPTEYLETAKKFAPLKVISNQPKSWRPYTKRWLEKHIAVEELLWVKPHEKLKRLKPGDWLVEDYPFFENYNQIILIDRPYNQGVAARIRVCTPQALEQTIRLLERRDANEQDP